jgi:predicted deacetylase
MPQTTDSLLLASIHDVSPRFETEVDQLADLLLPHVGERIALLVVPNHWGDAPIVAGSAFVRRLRGWAEAGFEIFLHGYFHRDTTRHRKATDRVRARLMTAGEGEFLGLSREAAAARIAEGRAMLEDLTGRPIGGVVAPAWLYGKGALAALSDCAIPIAEDHMRVWSPVSGRTLARGPVITWATRSWPRLASSLAVAPVLRKLPLRTLRIGVHPPDTRHPSIVRSIEASLNSALRSRMAGRYSDLVDTPRRDFQYSSAASVSSGFAK